MEIKVEGYDMYHKEQTRMLCTFGNNISSWERSKMILEAWEKLPDVIRKMYEDQADRVNKAKKQKDEGHGLLTFCERDA